MIVLPPQVCLCRLQPLPRLLPLLLFVLISVNLVIAGDNRTARHPLNGRKAFVDKKPPIFDFQCLNKSTTQSWTRPGKFSGTLTIRSSKRILPQLVSRIYAIFLRDVFRTGQRIELKNELRGSQFPLESGEVSLETWQVADAHEYESGQNNHHGSIYPTGVMGWFIPKKLIGNGNLPEVPSYHLFQGNITEDVWEQFEIDASTALMIRKFAELDSSSNELPNGLQTYTPPHCENTHSRCVTLLAGYYWETNFVKNHIEKFNLSVQVIWFGANLRHVVQVLFKMYLNHSNEANGRLQKFLVFDYSPSSVIDGNIEFVPLLMPNCKEILQVTVHCAYSYMPVVKYVSHNQEMSMPHVQDFTKNFHFEEDAYRNLIEQYEVLQDSKGIHPIGEEMLNYLACEYVKENLNNLLSYTRSQSNDPIPQYKIGLLLPKSPSIYGNIYHAALAATLAVNNNTNILPHVQLNVSTIKISCDEQQIMKSYLLYHMTASNVVGLLGPPCTRGLDSVSTFSEVIAMTTISYGATVNSFEANNGYRNFFRTVGESRFFEASVLQVLDQLGWRRIATLVEDGLVSSYLSVSFDLRLKEHNIEVLMHHKLPVLRGTNADGRGLIVDRLVNIRNKRAKIILMEIYDMSTAVQVMCEAVHQNMTAKDGFFWIIPSWIGDYVGLERGGRNDTLLCSESDLKVALDHQFSFHYPAFGNDGDRLPHLNNLTTGDWLKAYKESLGTDVREPKYAGYIYDAVWTYAFALDRMFQSGNLTLLGNLHHPDNHDKFLNAIKETNFTGVSGQIDFENGQSRRPQIILSQWQNMKLYQVGVEWRKNQSFYLEEDKIVWPGGIDGPPSDGRSICPIQSVAVLFNLSCDTAILVVTVFISLTGAILACLVFYWYVRRFYNEKMKLSAQVMRNLGIDLMKTNRAPENLLVDWEIPKDQIMLNRKLGEGAFGTVYGGQAYINGSTDLQAVAVKTLKVGSTAEDRLDFLSEAEAMKRFNHPNILKLLGVCLQSEPIFSVIEFMLYGDLKTYLLARRHLIKERIPDDSDVSAKRLTGMTTDIVRGLVYLAEQKYVHRDIACRNCLVNADRRVKIADFGMARPTGSNDYYRFSRKGLLPVRWLSPESLGSGFFTPASDVWSLGVLLFEIVSFGAFPYQGLSNNEVLEFVKNGGSMNVPAGVKEPLAKLMKSCWTPDYKKRPSAQQILEFISNNPRLVAPSVDVPHFSIQFSDSESDDQLEFMPPLANQSPDSGVGMGMPEISSLTTSQAAAEAFQGCLKANGNSRVMPLGKGFMKVNTSGGGVPNGNMSLNYNPVEPLLLRQNSNEMSSSSSSLLLRYVPMCGFGSNKKASSTANYTNHSTDGGSIDDSEYTRMSISEL